MPILNTTEALALSTLLQNIVSYPPPRFKDSIETADGSLIVLTAVTPKSLSAHQTITLEILPPPSENVKPESHLLPSPGMF